MQPEIRRIVAVEVYRRRCGRCPLLIYSLGTGEGFEIQPAANGFVDIASGLVVRSSGEQVLLPDARTTIDIRMNGDVGFEGFDHSSNEFFSGRAGGGVSVTVYDSDRTNFFQYAIAAESDRF